MLGQQIITKTGVKTKFDLAIQRLKAFEPPEGYWWLQKDCNGGSTCTDVSDAERG